MSAIPAEPEYAVHDVVRYLDRNGRLQEGRVLYIQANWPGWSDPSQPVKPILTYTIVHPTYRDKRMHVGAGDVVRLIKAAPIKEGRNG